MRTTARKHATLLQQRDKLHTKSIVRRAASRQFYILKRHAPALQDTTSIQTNNRASRSSLGHNGRINFYVTCLSIHIHLDADPLWICGDQSAAVDATVHDTWILAFNSIISLPAAAVTCLCQGANNHHPRGSLDFPLVRHLFFSSCSCEFTRLPLGFI